jgi:sigma-E factor negative regulatory protein RseB
MTSAGLAGLACWVLLSCGLGQAQTPSTPRAVLPVGLASERVSPSPAGVNEWLVRIHEASNKQSYAGVFVVSVEGRMSSARIWHACDGAQQVERVEALSGTPRSTFRRNEQVLTFFPESRVVLSETRESLGLFPNLLQSNPASIGHFYDVKPIGVDRVAGFVADVVQLRPQDNFRFGYRVWTEKKTGLVLKLQTLNVQGRVLEQSAFSELQLEMPVSVAKLSQMMDNTQGYRVETPELIKTSPEAQGWVLRTEVPGFKSMNCYKRLIAVGPEARHDSTVQWVFSDGLASVSLFIEAFDPRRHLQAELQALGSTYALTRRLNQWWVTAVGEVPPQTLTAFMQGLARVK